MLVRVTRRILPLLVLVAATCVLTAPPGWAAEPLVLDRERSLSEQYGYAPDYTRNVPAFDAAGNAYIRSRTSVGNATSYVHTMDDGAWRRLDFLSTLRAAYPTLASVVGAGGLRSERIVFDRQDRAYNPLTVRLADGDLRNVLMVSEDHCRSWAVYELPAGHFAVEHWVGHNQIDGPPFLAVWRPLTNNPAPRGQRFRLWVTQPRLEGERLVLPPLTHVTDQCLGLNKDSGGSSFAVTHNGMTTFVWAEAGPRSARVTPQLVATYDPGAGTVSAPQRFAATHPDNDVHNKPGICVDSQGYLHVVAGAHGGPVTYRRSLLPDDIEPGWTPPVSVLSDGYVKPDGSRFGRLTYNAFVCDSQDVLHLITRQFRRGVDDYFDGAVYGALVHQRKTPDGEWSAPTLIVVPAEAGYAVHYHKLALDHRDRLFLSCSPSGGSERDRAKTRAAMLAVLGRSQSRQAKYQRRMLLVSDDGGDGWRLATNEDLVGPSQRPAAPSRRTAAPPPRLDEATQMTWSWLRPRPLGNQLTAIDIPDGRNGWAVGAHGTILRTTNGGRHWKVQPLRTRADLFSVVVTSPKAGWIVGQDGLILRTRNGGRTWSRQASGTTQTLFALAARSERRAWAVGDRGTIVHTRNGGRTWLRQKSLTRERLYGVTFVSADRGWACGGDGRLRLTVNGGKRWQSQRSPTHKALFDISFRDRLRGVAVGDDGCVVRTTNGGRTWRTRKSGTGGRLRTVHMLSKTRVLATGAGGLLLTSGNGGRTWKPSSLPLRGMCGALGAAKSRLWVAGEGGRPVRSRNGGRTWTAVSPGVSSALRAVSDDGRGLLVAGQGGLLLEQAHGVGRWQPIALPVTGDLTELSVAGPDAWLLARDGTVLRRDESSAWRPLSGEAAGATCLSALAGGRAWLITKTGHLLATQDGGRSWRSQTVPRDVHCLQFTDAYHGWAGGGLPDGEERAFVLSTADGGRSWRRNDLPVWGNVTKLLLLDADEGWAVAEDWGADGDVRGGSVLHTVDGGRSWQIQTRVEAVLHTLCMLDDLHGWAFGEDGTALQTTDGGATWTAHDAGTDSTLRAATGLAGDQILVVGDGGVMLLAGP